MRAQVVQIAWHPCEADGGKNAPILSLHFAPAAGARGRMVATSAQDGTCRLWRLGNRGEGTGASEEGFTYVLDFEGHNMSVNSVRFSPNGECLAAAGDNGAVIVWHLITPAMARRFGMDVSTIDFPATWDDVMAVGQLQRVIFQGKVSEIYDLAWSADSKYIFTGSVDGSVAVWNTCRSKLVHQSKEHKGFVQGLATDPLGQYFVSQCASRTCRLHNINEGKKLARFKFTSGAVVKQRQVGWIPRVARKDPGAAAAVKDAATKDAVEGKAAMKSHALFLDNMSTSTFFRRPAWSVDGSLFFAPTGQFKALAGDNYRLTTYLFSRNQWER